MEISDVRVELAENPSDRLKAFCTITLDEVFVIRDLKVVEGVRGLFVAMPSRRMTTPCGKCRHRNHLRARFCNDCGSKLPPAPTQSGEDGRSRFHRDIAHPITSEYREVVQERVLEAFHAESRFDEVEENDTDESHEASMSEYDTLIADLNGSASGKSPDSAEPADRSRRRSSRDDPSADRAAAAEPADKGQSGRRKRRRRPQEKEGQEVKVPQTADEHPEAKPSADEDVIGWRQPSGGESHDQQPEPAPVPEAASEESAQATPTSGQPSDRDDQCFEPIEVKESKDKAEQPAATADLQNDNAAFGAGIL